MKLEKTDRKIQYLKTLQDFKKLGGFF